MGLITDQLSVTCTKRHSGIAAKEEADHLAKQAATSQNIGMDQGLGVRMSPIIKHAWS